MTAPDTLVARFETAARRDPSAVAVVADGERLTYGALERRADHLARRLIAAGAGPERLVGVALPRSAELVVALLAVLKSGAACLPADPGYPPGRIAYVLGDARPAVLLAEPDPAARPGNCTSAGPRSPGVVSAAPRSPPHGRGPN